MEKLLDEIQEYKNSKFTEEPVETVYFGGGTPSLLKISQVEAIFDALKEVFKLNLREVTFETNPDDVTIEYLSGLRDAGITRCSMGIQSFQPELLKFMNRAHTREEALQSLELLKKAEFDSFTVDLIYGNPNQTTEQLLDDVDLLLKFNPPHVSAYSLTVEPNTRLGKQVELGRVIPTADNVVAEHFLSLNERLTSSGIVRYEVSNYSQRGAEAVHNSNYWNHQNYLGLGPGAHSFWLDEKPMRRQNEASLQNYPTENDPEYLTMQQVAEERIMMGLRTREGVAINELQTRYDYHFNERQIDYLNQKEKEGKLTLNSSVKLTDAGILIADAIVLDLVTLVES